MMGITTTRWGLGGSWTMNKDDKNIGLRTVVGLRPRTRIANGIFMGMGDYVDHYATNTVHCAEPNTLAALSQEILDKLEAIG